MKQLLKYIVREIQSDITRQCISGVSIHFCVFLFIVKEFYCVKLLFIFILVITAIWKSILHCKICARICNKHTLSTIVRFYHIRQVCFTIKFHFIRYRKPMKCLTS